MTYDKYTLNWQELGNIADKIDRYSLLAISAVTKYVRPYTVKLLTTTFGIMALRKLVAAADSTTLLIHYDRWFSERGDAPQREIELALSTLGLRYNTPFSAKASSEMSDSADFHICSDWVAQLINNAWPNRWIMTILSHLICQIESGHFGFLPQDTQVGDFVSLSLSLNMPLIARQSSSDVDKHYLIRPAYIYGLMNGEGLTLDTWREEEICIR